MGFRRAIVRGSILIALAAVMATALDLLRSIAVARLLEDPDLIGLLSILGSIRGLFLTFAVFGIPTAVTRYFAQLAGGASKQPVRLIRTSLSVSLLLGPVASLMMFAASWFIASDVYRRPELLPLIQVGAFSVATTSLQLFLAGALRGLHKMASLALLLVMEGVIALSASVLLVVSYGLIGAAYAILVGSGASLILGLALLSREHLWRIGAGIRRPDVSAFSEIARFTLPLLASGFVVLLKLLAAETFLALHVSFSDLGLYRIGFGFYSLLISLPGIVAVPMMPMLVSMRERNPERLGTVFSQTLRLMMFVAIPPIVFVALASHALLWLLYGEVYVAAHLFTSVLVLSAAFVSLLPTISSLLMGTGRSLVVLLVDITWAAIFVPASVALVSLYGLLGMSYAHLAAGLAVFVIELIYLKRGYGIRLAPFRTPLLTMVIALMATLVITYTAPNSDRIFYAVPASVAVGAACLALLTSKERHLLRASLKDLLTAATLREVDEP